MESALIPNSKDPWPRIAVMGAGAVGCYFGGMLARAGAPVTLVGRPALVDAVNGSGLFIDSIHFKESVKISASAQPSAVRDADIVLFCVKTLGMEEAAAAMRPHLSSGAVVVSLQNGVDNAERLSACGIEAIASVVYVAAAMTGPARVQHSGRGELVIGHPTRAADLKLISETFAKAGVKCRISQNLAGDLWSKLVWNCAGNAISALGRSTYAQVADNEHARNLLIAAAEEVIAVGRTAGVVFPPIDIPAAGLKLARDLGPATSSTAQDVERRKKTEIDSLNGYVVRRGKELGVPTPVNSALYALVKLLEDRFD
jgi:2-dehydropantoate 2-reductase